MQVMIERSPLKNREGNCEEELPKKPVGRLSAVCRPFVGRLSVTCRPTVDRQSADRFFGELFFTITGYC